MTDHHKRKLTGVRKRRYLALLFVVMGFSVLPLQAQPKSFSVSWVAEVSTAKGFLDEGSLWNRIRDFIFGPTTFALKQPISVLALSASNFWVMDRGYNNIIHADRDRHFFSPLPTDDKAALNSPVAVCRGADGRLLFTDSRQNRIYVLNPANGERQVLNDTLALNRPTGIAFNRKTREIWVAETAAHRLLVLTAEGQVVRKIGFRGTGPGQFNFPTFIWIDAFGTIFVVDSMNFRVQIFDAKGNFITMFGEAGDATGYFAHPKGIATDSYGHIYVADALFHTVQIFDRAGRFLYNFGKQGRGREEFWMPSGIYIDSEDRIYVADSFNKRIQIFDVREEGKDEK